MNPADYLRSFFHKNGVALGFFLLIAATPDLGSLGWGMGLAFGGLNVAFGLWVAFRHGG